MSNGVFKLSPTFTEKQQELEILKTLFKSIDLDSNGTLTAEEFHEAIRKIMPKINFSFETTKLFFTNYDSNLDRQLDFSEFLKMYTTLDDHYKLFSVNDSKKSDCLNSRELSNIFRGMSYNWS